MGNWHLPPYSHRILLVIAAAYLLNLIGQNIPASWVVLQPVLVAEKGEFWRMLTYPLAISSFWGMLIFGFTFYFIAPEVEAVVSSRRFLWGIASLSLLQAALFLAVFWNIPYAFGGVQSIALGVLVAFAYLFPRSEVALFGFALPAWGITALFAGFSIFPKLIFLRSELNIALELLITDVFAMAAGMLFAHSNIHKVSYQLSRPEPIVESPMFTMDTPMIKSASLRQKLKSAQATPEEVLSQFFSDEDRLNAILDKINESGQNSLSAEERAFLEEYSRRL